MSASLALRLLAPPVNDGSGTSVLTHLKPLLRRCGVEFECGTPDAVLWLTRRGGEAVTLPWGEGKVNILFLSKRPSLSAVLEELAHFLQHRASSHDEEDIRLMVCLREVEAKQCLADNQVQLGIPAEEHQITLKQLEAERLHLKTLQELLR